MKNYLGILSYFTSGQKWNNELPASDINHVYIWMIGDFFHSVKLN